MNQKNCAIIEGKKFQNFGEVSARYFDQYSRISARFRNEVLELLKSRFGSSWKY